MSDKKMKDQDADLYGGQSLKPGDKITGLTEFLDVAMPKDDLRRRFIAHDVKIREALGDYADSPLSTDVLAANMRAERDRLQQKITDNHNSGSTDQLETIRVWTRLSLRMPGFCSVDEWMGLTIEARDVIQREVLGQRFNLSQQTAEYRESQFPINKPTVDHTITFAGAYTTAPSCRLTIAPLHYRLDNAGRCACGDDNCSDSGRMTRPDQIDEQSAQTWLDEINRKAEASLHKTAELTLTQCNCTNCRLKRESKR